MGKKSRKEEKKREKAMSRMTENRDGGGDGYGYGFQDDELIDDDSGICPCAAHLNPDMLCANLSQQGGVHITCEKCDEQSNASKSTKKGGKKSKHAKRGQRDTSLPTGGGAMGGATFFCLTCGFCGCEGHCREHFSDVKYRNKKGHGVYLKNNLFTGYGGVHKGKCFDCNLTLSERFNDPDTVAEDTVKGCPVDFSGYVIDDEANEGFSQCCQHVIDVASSGDTSHLPQSNWKKGGNKKNKHLQHANNRSKKQRKQLRAKHNNNHSRSGVSRAAKDAGLKGLQNLGNTCFFNSVIQSVSNTPGMVESVMRASSEGKIGSFTTAVYALILKLHSSTESVTAQLRMLLSELHRTGPQFSGYGQHDAHELTRFMSERVELEYISNAKKSEGEPDPVTNPFFNSFHGVLLSDVRCTTCGQTSNIEEPFYDISLAVTRAIDSSLDLFFTDELLEGYKHPCKHCNEVEFAAVRARQEREKAQMIETIKQQAAERESVSLKELLQEYESDSNDDDDDEGSSEGSVEETDEDLDDDDFPQLSSRSNSRPSSLQGDAVETAASISPPPSDKQKETAEETQPEEEKEQVTEDDKADEKKDEVKVDKEEEENEAPKEDSPRTEIPSSSESKPKMKKITTDASKQYSIKKFPQTLVIHLKRFAFCRSTCAFVKDNKKIDIPSTLDLTPWMAEDYEGSPKYEISSTIEHQGEVGYGHYISHTLTQNKWFECNDSWVTESSFSAATRSPYLVFYSSVKE